MASPVKAWSFSRWDMWHTCPLLFKLRHIDKLEEPTGEAMLNGRRVHNTLKDYLLLAPDQVRPTAQVEAAAQAAGKAWSLVQEVAAFDNKVVEQQWGYTVNWAPTSWFGPATWFRSIIDVGVLYDDQTAEVVDWKTGKPRGTYDQEMELFAISVMARAPQVTHVTTRLAFTDFKSEVFADFPRSDLYNLMRKWNAAVQPMFEDTTFLPRPNDKCKFCHFSRSNTGKCRYG